MFGQFFVLFAMVGVGCLCSRRGWITQEVNTGLGSLVMQVTCPALLFVTISGNDIAPGRLPVYFGVAAAQYGAMLLGGRLMRLFCRDRGYSAGELGMLECSLATVNNGFIGLPVAMLFFGQVAALYMSAAFFGVHLYLWTYGIYALQGKGGALSWKAMARKIVNPNCMMVFLGLLFSLTGWAGYLPVFLKDFLSTLGNLSTPLSLIYIGAMAGNTGLKRLLGQGEAMRLALLKMLLFPGLTAAVLYVLPAEPMLKTAFLVSMTCPCAAIMPMVTEQYGTGKGMAMDVTLLTTFFSMLTLPACIWLCGVLF